MSDTPPQCRNCGSFLAKGEGHYCNNVGVQFSKEWVADKFEETGDE